MTGAEAVGVGLGFLAIVAPEFWPKMPRALSYTLAGIGLAWLTYSGILGVQELSDEKLQYGPLAIIVGGAVLIAAGLFWHISRLGAEDNADKITTPKVENAAGELLLECQSTALPNSGPPRETNLIMIEPFRFDKEGTIGFSTMPTEWGEPIKWPEDWKNKPMSSARCRLTNYGAAPLFNVEVPFKVIFRRLARGEAAGSATAKEVINVAEASLPITKIESGPERAYVFYIHNQGRDVIQTEFLEGSTCLPPGSTERKPVTLIQSTSIIHRYMTLWPIRSAEEIVAEEEKTNAAPQTVRSPVAAPLTQPAGAPMREFAKLTATQLMALYNTLGLSKIQTAKLVEPYQGLWLETEAVVVFVLPDSHPRRTYGQFKDDGGALIECRFGPEWINHISRMNQSDRVKIRGKISSINDTAVYLLDCEIP
jgi:hypothetical protein